MRKRFLLPLFFFVAVFSFADVGTLEKQFIKGSISEKITAVQEASGSDALFLAIKGMDYAIENVAMLGTDRELSALALASVLATPKLQGVDVQNVFHENEIATISEKLIGIFNLFDDETVRLAVLDRLEGYTTDSNGATQTLLNDYLARAFNTDAAHNAVIKRTIELLGFLGNETSLTIIYNVWLTNKWPDSSESTKRSLVLLSSKSLTESMKILSNAELADAARFFIALKDSTEISPVFLCELAENVLILTINKAETLQDGDEVYRNAFLRLQTATLSAISANQWAHASEIVNLNLTLAKNEYEAGILTDELFAAIITASAKLPTSELAQLLSEYLAECNSKVEASKSDSEMPAKSVVLALISALETLGDKTAFDNLLYVTYLPNYPQDVVDAARHALASLKW